MKKENYLLISSGWDDTGVLVPLSTAAMLKDALFFKTKTRQNKEGQAESYNVVEHFKPGYGGLKTQIISWEAVAAAITAGQMDEEGD